MAKKAKINSLVSKPDPPRKRGKRYLYDYKEAHSLSRKNRLKFYGLQKTLFRGRYIQVVFLRQTSNNKLRESFKDVRNIERIRLLQFNIRFSAELAGTGVSYIPELPQDGLLNAHRAGVKGAVDMLKKTFRAETKKSKRKTAKITKAEARKILAFVLGVKPATIKRYYDEYAKITENPNSSFINPPKSHDGHRFNDPILANIVVPLASAVSLSWVGFSTISYIFDISPLISISPCPDEDMSSDLHAADHANRPKRCGDSP